jgi:hypothetical protein
MHIQRCGHIITHFYSLVLRFSRWEEIIASRAVHVRMEYSSTSYFLKQACTFLANRKYPCQVLLQEVPAKIDVSRGHVEFLANLTSSQYRKVQGRVGWRHLYRGVGKITIYGMRRYPFCRGHSTVLAVWKPDALHLLKIHTGFVETPLPFNSQIWPGTFKSVSLQCLTRSQDINKSLEPLRERCSS